MSTAATARRVLVAMTEYVPPPCRADGGFLWFSSVTADREQAASACLTQCHALTACSAYAHAAGETSGVWGGVDRGRMPHPNVNPQLKERE